MNAAGELYGGLIDPYEIGKEALAKIADLGATRAGRLVGEIRDSLWQLNQEGADNKYLQHHIDALFKEFITGEDYDLLYYNKPESDIAPCNQVKITYDNLTDIKDSTLCSMALQYLDKGEINYINRRHMSDEWLAKNLPIKPDVELTHTNHDLVYEMTHINSVNGQCKDLVVPHRTLKKKWYQEDIINTMSMPLGWLGVMLAAVGVSMVVGMISAAVLYGRAG